MNPSDTLTAEEKEALAEPGIPASAVSFASDGLQPVWKPRTLPCIVSVADVERIKQAIRSQLRLSFEMWSHGGTRKHAVPHVASCEVEVDVTEQWSYHSAIPTCLSGHAHPGRCPFIAILQRVEHPKGFVAVYKVTD